MSIGKIIQLVGLAVAIVAGLVAIPQAALIIAVLGLVGGYFVTADDRVLFLVATIALVTVAASLGAIPAVGMYLTAVLTNLGAWFSAAAITVIIITSYEKLSP